MEIPLLRDIIIIFALAILVIGICHRIGIPAIVGFLFTGVLAGPHAFGLVHDSHDVNLVAEIGILLLLFAIGMEFPLGKLKHIKSYFFLGGGLQVLLTVICGFFIGLGFGRPLGESVLVGFLLSMSSTAIVLKALESQEETNSPQGRVCLGILIFQDIVAVPMIMVTPFLGEGHETAGTSFMLPLIKSVIFLSLLFFVALKVVPKVLYSIAKVQSRELFLLSGLTICFTVAWFASSLGLSLSLGAFLAGLIIAESDYNHELIGDIIPLKDLFSSLFFVSIGMLLDLEFVWHNPFAVLSTTLLVLVVKAFVVGTTAMILGMPLRIMILSGLAMCQIGEFSFVLAKAGSDYGLGTSYYYQLFLSVALLSMAVTPTIIRSSGSIINFILRLPLPSKLKNGLNTKITKEESDLKNHIIIVGFGLNGKYLARASASFNIPYMIVEMNPETVKREKSNGEPIFFGDATHDLILNHANVKFAKAAAVMINDPPAARRIVRAIRKLNPNIFLIVRTRYIFEKEKMMDLGANEVIPDEYGTSIEIFSRTLRRFDVSNENIKKMISEMDNGFEMARYQE